eukprot:TRINITY_DN92307_c0_g1_i1.p1 TRINITY_DN92307_c0_g1~~TRINITY_DN92307_c0_g1_i1.p1  ORF type:complete len:395 (+),score=73.27 TRINITY_DN92307_c0_g1_i1:139-1323(+)
MFLRPMQNRLLAVLALLHAPLAQEQESFGSFVRWVEPAPDSGVVDVPSKATLSCKIFAWVDDWLRGVVEEKGIFLCVEAASAGPELIFCEAIQKPGIVAFELPLEHLDGIITLKAELTSQVPEIPGKLASNVVRIQKWLKLSRETPPWADADNPLIQWWDSHRSGLHASKIPNYFDVYHRHLQRFRGRPVHMLEIGVASGGSLEMWKAYFGPNLTITGVDCCPWPGMKNRLRDAISSVQIGDQEDPAFWQQLLATIPAPDIVLDDGGHIGRQQVASFKSIWQQLAPGGVYIVEDLYHAYLDDNNKGRRMWMELLQGLLNDMQTGQTDDPDLQGLVSSIQSINVYRHISLLEKYSLGQGKHGLAQDWAKLEVGAGTLALALEGKALRAPSMVHPD